SAPVLREPSTPREPTVAPSSGQPALAPAEPSASAEPPSRVTASGSSAPTAATIPSSATRGDATGKLPINRKPKATPKPGCDPPYVLNPDGTKRFKPECF